MAVYKRGYQRYAGSLTGPWTRFMVLPRYAWDRLYQQRLVILLTTLAFVWPLLCAGFVYLSNHIQLLQGLDREFLDFIRVDGRFFSIFMYVQSVFAIFLAALAGPGLIAPDLANNALPLYLSRPLTRWKYALARLIVIVGMLSVVTWRSASHSSSSWPVSPRWLTKCSASRGGTRSILHGPSTGCGARCWASMPHAARGLVLLCFRWRDLSSCSSS
jgi:hypothetical protein